MEATDNELIIDDGSGNEFRSDNVAPFGNTTISKVVNVAPRDGRIHDLDVYRMSITTVSELDGPVIFVFDTLGGQVERVTAELVCKKCCDALWSCCISPCFRLGDCIASKQ